MNRITAAGLLLTTATLAGPIGCAEKQDEYDRELAAWVAAGHPIDPHEMLPASVPDSRNAVTYYLQAGRMVEALPAADLDSLRKPINSHMLIRLAPKLEPILAVIEKGRACDSCVWPIEVDDPLALLQSSLEYTGAMRNAARVYQAFILSEGKAGRQAQAMCYVERGLEVAADLDAAPVSLHPMIKLAMQSLLLDAYREVFAEGELPPNRVARYLEETKIETEVRRAAVLETVSWLAAFENGLFDDRLTGRKEEKAARAELAWLLGVMNQALAGDAATVQATYQSTWPTPRVIFDGQAPPQPWAPLLHVDRQLAPLVLNRLGVELREYKARHGDYPEDYDMPIDPLTGEPYVYTKTRRGCVVESRYEASYPIEWRWE